MLIIKLSQTKEVQNSCKLTKSLINIIFNVSGFESCSTSHLKTHRIIQIFQTAQYLFMSIFHHDINHNHQTGNRSPYIFVLHYKLHRISLLHINNRIYGFKNHAKIYGKILWFLFTSFFSLPRCQTLLWTFLPPVC